jgi:hypothetical protein
LGFVGNGGMLEISEHDQSVKSGSLVLLKSRRQIWGARNDGTNKIFVLFFFISGPAIPSW